jgi:hypothetical protein
MDAEIHDGFRLEAGRQGPDAERCVETAVRRGERSGLNVTMITQDD